MAKVSVIIPCYNLGEYLQEAVNSVLQQTFQDFEIIIVNDGSTDDSTLQVIDSINNNKTKIFHTKNQGLAAARNFAIEQATGKYILPLDSDDKIAPSYLEKGLAILEKNQEIGILYCLAEFFGSENGKWDLPEFEPSRMILENLIFCSAIFQKTDWETVGGYKTSLKYGWEDYEFWLSIIELNKKIYRIPEHLFFYRKRQNSMTTVMTRDQLLYSHYQIANNHPKFFLSNINILFDTYYNLKEELEIIRNDLINRDTRIHEQNLEISRLNEIISIQDFKLSDRKTLTKLLFQIIKSRVLSKIGIK